MTHRLRASAAFTILAFIGTACSGTEAATEVPTDAVTTSTTSLVAPEPELPVPTRADPVATSLETLQTNDPRLGTLIRSEEAALAHACAGAALSGGADADLLTQITSAAGSLEVAGQPSSTARTIAGLIEPCHGDRQLLTRLISVSDAQLAECIVDRLGQTQQTEALLAALLLGTEIGATSAVSTFRFSCQTAVLDAAFGAHPGGTTGEDIRLAAAALVRDVVAMTGLSAYEDACLTRGTMFGITAEWARQYLGQTTESFQNAGDFLLGGSTPPDLRDAALRAIDGAVLRCIDPFELLGLMIGLDGVAPEAEGCVRDGLEHSLLTQVVTDAMRGDGATAFENEEFISVFEGCGLVPE